MRAHVETGGQKYVQFSAQMHEDEWLIFDLISVYLV